MQLRKLTEIESELKEEIIKDRTSEKVFNLIYELVYRYIMRSKKIEGYNDKVEIATIAAEELYMKVYNGYEINCWIGYIAKVLISFIKTYRYMNDPQVINTYDDPNLREGVIRMSSSSSQGILERRSKDYDKVLDLVFCESVPSTIDQILIKYCRFNEDSPEWIKIRSAIIIDMITDGNADSFFIDKDLYPYYRFIFNVVKYKLIDQMNKDFENCDFFGGVINQLQFETMIGGLN